VAGRRAHVYTFRIFGLAVWKTERITHELPSPELVSQVARLTQEIENMKLALESLAIAVKGLADLVKSKIR